MLKSFVKYRAELFGAEELLSFNRVILLYALLKLYVI